MREMLDPWARWLCATFVLLTGCSHDAATASTDAGGDTVEGYDAGPLDAAAVARGAMFVQQRGCPICHQSANPSDGLMSGQSSPQSGTSAYPSNLTPELTTGIGLWTDWEIAKAIRKGERRTGQPMCVMPVFDTMSDDEVSAIVTYLRSLPPVLRTIPATTCPADGG